MSTLFPDFQPWGQMGKMASSPFMSTFPITGHHSPYSACLEWPWNPRTNRWNLSTMWGLWILLQNFQWEPKDPNNRRSRSSPDNNSAITLPCNQHVHIGEETHCKHKWCNSKGPSQNLWQRLQCSPEFVPGGIQVIQSKRLQKHDGLRMGHTESSSSIWCNFFSGFFVHRPVKRQEQENEDAHYNGSSKWFCPYRLMCINWSLFLCYSPFSSWWRLYWMICTGWMHLCACTRVRVWFWYLASLFQNEHTCRDISFLWQSKF